MAANDLTAYIPGLPSGFDDNELETIIQARVETMQRIKLTSVKCYSKLSVGVIQFKDKDDKTHLVSNVQSIVLDPQKGINVTFVDELELDSYIVVDRKMSKLPSPDEISQRYAKVFTTGHRRSCETVCIQFPNIFRIQSGNLDELIKIAHAPDLKIDNTYFATVYPRADCSFFEDLPTNMAEDQISSAIATQIGEKSLPSTSFYVQYDKHAGIAVVVATRSVQKWIQTGHLTINEQNISKKAKLAYRVIVAPVPPGFDLHEIFKNKVFGNQVISHKHIEDKLIVELDNIDSYQNCLEIGALRIGDDTMNIKPHSAIGGDLDNIDLDAANWYETTMLDIKPDITTIMDNQKHPIFRYKWNADNWVNQMEKAKGGERQANNKYDHKRHLLRVTVMLNTIGVLRKGKYFVDDQEVKLNVQKLHTVGYDHKSKLSFGRKIHESELKTPFESTKVKVENADCLVLYEKLVNEGYKPLLLNMANATSPGGGYRKGDGAQEENIFRRSDYYHSLDAEIAEKGRAERFACTQKCDLRQVKGYNGLYPMEEFGAIYTSGITVFRHTEERGYDFMKNPMYNVCSIAMAAYRDPPLTKNNTLENKAATNTRKKIENIFAIGHHQKHDCLVLSAFGCGAFKNPPKHVALLFKSVVYQYAGYFKEIYFAIVDDHNTGNRINPEGNFLPFQRELDNLVVKPPKTFRANGVSGPYRILSRSPDGQLSLGDSMICYLPPCQHGTKCRDIKDGQHNNSFLHPPMCPLQSTTTVCDQMDDEVHMFTFIHIMKCKNGGKCEIKDQAHLSEYDHPDYCEDGVYCHNIDSEHLSAFRHLPCCRDGITCAKRLKDAEHDKAFRHLKTFCSHDNNCVYFHEKEHYKNTIHTFREPCPFTPYNCKLFVQFIQNNGQKDLPSNVERHCYEYSHVCPHGRQCKTKDNRHYEITIHIARIPCLKGGGCDKINEENHLESFSHDDIRDIRYFCKEPGFSCKQKYEDQHMKRFRHGKNLNYLSTAPSKNLNATVNFVRNQKQMIRNVNAYVDANGWTKAKTSPDILNWIRALQPVHRCGQMIFESILVHGHVMSRNYMKALEYPKNVAKAVLQHSRIRRIFLQHNTAAVKEAALAFIKGLVDSEYAKSGIDGMSLAKLDVDHEENINLHRKKLEASLKATDMKVIYDWTIKIAQASIKIVTNPMGIGYDVDEIMGTNKHVFSILGPHLGFYYGDIVIIFKQDIMFHPDTNFSPQAATRFHSTKIYPDRPWVPDRGSEGTRVEDFYNAKLHCSVPRFEYAAAAELIASTGLLNKSANVSLDDAIQRWISVDSHETFECHLPQLIPLDYVDRVYITQNTFDALSLESKQSAKGAFGDALIITKHTLDLSLVKPGGMVSFDSTRQIYLAYIINEIQNIIKENMKAQHISRGIVITIPSSQFSQHIVLPMTIYQSYELYCLDNKGAPNSPESTYIYWKAMHGDMMLTITNEKIDLKKEQKNLRCLVCYVAEKPSMASEDYHEAYSYINDGSPFQHDRNVSEARFRAKSNVFYRGCNIDDFFTFCLKITYQTNEATLSHAGPNGIYNHQTITHQFDKSKLDLSRVDYIHISAGREDVPIRNLTIHHEKVPEYHPTHDESFKTDTTVLQGKRPISPGYGHHHHSHYGGGAPNNNAAVNNYQAQPLRAPAKAVTKEENLSFFGRLQRFFNCSKVDTYAVVSEAPDKDKSTPHEPYRGGPPSRPKTPPASLPSSKLPRCKDSIYCLNQDVREHTEKYSHPCRFNELCRNAASESHLTHEKHDVPRCTANRDCTEKTDPIHRAKYRHTGLPDYLYPCRHQDTCYDRSVDHRTKYFHGEEIPSFKSKTSFHKRKQ